MAFVTKHTGMFQRARYDRYDPRLLEQMYGCPEYDLSHGWPVDPAELCVGGFFPVLYDVQSATKKLYNWIIHEWLLKNFRKRYRNTSGS